MVRQTREKRGDKKRVDNTPPTEGYSTALVLLLYARDYGHFMLEPTLRYTPETTDI